jgi:mono/diheme cytochrome c family protein
MKTLKHSRRRSRNVKLQLGRSWQAGAEEMASSSRIAGPIAECGEERIAMSRQLFCNSSLPLVLSCVLIFAAVSAGTARAAGSPEQGRSLAKTWCASCHAVEPGGVQRDAPAPPFPTIAERARPEQLRAFLNSPHPPMPNFNLSRSQIDDIVAYLQSFAK